MEAGKFRELLFGSLQCFKIKNKAYNISLWNLVFWYLQGSVAVCLHHMYILYLYMTYMTLYIPYLYLFIRNILSRRKENIVILDKCNLTFEVEWVRKNNISYFYGTLDVSKNQANVNGKQLWF